MYIYLRRLQINWTAINSQFVRKLRLDYLNVASGHLQVLTCYVTSKVSHLQDRRYNNSIWVNLNLVCKQIWPILSLCVRVSIRCDIHLVWCNQQVRVVTWILKCFYRCLHGGFDCTLATQDQRTTVVEIDCAGCPVETVLLACVILCIYTTVRECICHQSVFLVHIKN